LWSPLLKNVPGVDVTLSQFWILLPVHLLMLSPAMTSSMFVHLLSVLTVLTVMSVLPVLLLQLPVQLLVQWLFHVLSFGPINVFGLLLTPLLVGYFFFLLNRIKYL
jgi:hypothetical protein